jgi:hypothetical protein
MRPAGAPAYANAECTEDEILRTLLG